MVKVKYIKLGDGWVYCLRHDRVELSGDEIR